MEEMNMSEARNSLAADLSLLDSADITFLMVESKRLLAELEKAERSGAAILDPNLTKKKELIAQIEPIMDAIQNQWQALQEAEEEALVTEGSTLLASPSNKKSLIDKLTRQKVKLRSAKNKFKRTAKEFKSTILGVSALNISTEATVIDRINDLNENTENLNQIVPDLLAQFEALKKNTQIIAKLEYGKTLSTYLGYTSAGAKGIFTFWLAWIETLQEATKAAGAIFYPISATFTTIIKLFTLGARLLQLYIAKNEANKASSELARERLNEDIKLLRQSTVFKFVAFTLNFISILAFAGILTTPFGFILVAAATAVDWLDDGLGGWWRARQGQKKFEAAYKDSDQAIKDCSAYQEEKIAYQQKVKQTASAARWGFVNTVAMILIACAPIPVAGPFMSLAGLTLFGAVTVRNVYVAAKPYAIRLKNYFRPSKNTEQAEEKPDDAIELDTFGNRPKITVTPTPLDIPSIPIAASQEPVRVDFKASGLLKKLDHKENLSAAAALEKVEHATSTTPQKEDHKVESKAATSAESDRKVAATPTKSDHKAATTPAKSDHKVAATPTKSDHKAATTPAKSDYKVAATPIKSDHKATTPAKLGQAVLPPKQSISIFSPKERQKTGASTSASKTLNRN